MSKIVENFMTVIKGIRGAGDTIRGEAMDATDRVFDNRFNHTQTEAAQAKSRALAEKGRQEMRDADVMFGRHDFDPKDAAKTEETSSAQDSTAPPLPSRTAATSPEAPKDSSS
ncbi:hypothetical protein GGR52DRAFT_572810 [Hypoxylon sp. FL1284]|nr:hypothetical protein GGR52DRAFT_572810 [Hypoxylon sp. FL1284]